MSSIVGSSSIKREFTSGFVNGYEDLRHLMTDINDNWIKRIIGNHTSLNGLTTLTSLADPIKQLDEKWESARSPQLRRSIKIAAMIEDFLGSSKRSGSSVTDVITSLKNLPPVSKISGFSNMNGLKLNSDQLFYKLSTLTSLQAKISSQLSASDSSDIQRFVDEEVTPILNELKIDPNIESIGEVINGKHIIIARFPTKIADFKTFLDALNKLTRLSKETITPVKSMIEMYNVKIDKDFTSNMKLISYSISRNSLLGIGLQFNIIKTQPIHEYLVQLKGLAEYSKPLCDAVNLIDMMQKVLNKSSVLMDFVKNGHKVDEIKDNLKLMIDSYIEFKKDWRNSLQLSQQLFNLVHQIKTLQSRASILKTDKLEEYGRFLESARFENVDFDVEQRLKAIDTLYPQVSLYDKQILESLKASLEKVVDLDLSFSKFNISGISDSLTAIENIFHTVTPKPTTIPPPRTTLPTQAPRGPRRTHAPIVIDKKDPPFYLKPKNYFMVACGIGISAVWNLFRFPCHVITVLIIVSLIAIKLRLEVYESVWWIGLGIIIGSICGFFVFLQWEKRKEKKRREEAERDMQRLIMMRRENNRRNRGISYGRPRVNPPRPSAPVTPTAPTAPSALSAPSVPSAPSSPPPTN